MKLSYTANPWNFKQFDASIWLTTANQDCLFEKQSKAPEFTDQAGPLPSIEINATQTYQTMEGFGFSLTGISAHLLNRLPTSVREALLKNIFSTQDDAIGVSYLRLSIGAADLSIESFSYDDMPEGQTDFDLLHFDILAGDGDVIPILQEILAINPEINIMGSPWSAPPWMKTNHSFIGGSLKPECYKVYANYLVKYIQSMIEYGITVHAITPQNEPLHDGNDPSMLMPAVEQADFIKNHLGPSLRLAGLETKVICWDHNCDRPEYPLTIFADAQACEYVAGSAWHLYAGDISALSLVHDAYPDKQIYFTEQWVGSDGNFARDMFWHVKNVLIGSTRNWSSVILEWNLASAPDNWPYTQSSQPYSVGALTIGETVERNVAYYLVAHLSKFVRPGSVRIHSETDCGLLNVAFKTLDNSIVLLVLNDTDVDFDFTIQLEGKKALVRMPALALGTFVWQDY